MRLSILGCRGSTPATGRDYERYGGDTSAVAVSADSGPPTLVLDAGTGLRRLDDELGDEAFRGAILLTHLHWDHTHGLPFTTSVDRPDAEVDLYLPAQGADPLELLSRAIGPPHFPVTPNQLRGTWRFHALEEGHHSVAGFDILAGQIRHKGGRTFGYRIDDGKAAFAYLPDRSQGSRDEDPVKLVGGVELLLHDSQHTGEEYPKKAFLGHSSIEHAVELSERLDVGKLCLFHHDPTRTDREIDKITESVVDGRVPVVAGAAGLELWV